MKPPNKGPPEEQPSEMVFPLVFPLELTATSSGNCSATFSPTTTFRGFSEADQHLQLKLAILNTELDRSDKSLEVFPIQGLSYKSLERKVCVRVYSMEQYVHSLSKGMHCPRGDHRSRGCILLPLVDMIVYPVVSPWTGHSYLVVSL